MRAAAPQSRKASKIWMKETRNFLEDVKVRIRTSAYTDMSTDILAQQRSARDAQSDNLRKKLDGVLTLHTAHFLYPQANI